MSASDGPPEGGGQQRLLEGWLPLAQEASARYGWALAAPELEALILAAAQSLGRARSTLEACAVLWSVYGQTLGRGPSAGAEPSAEPGVARG